MGRVASLAGLAQPVAFDRFGQDHRRRSLMRHRRVVSREDLPRIVAAAPHLLKLLVRQVFGHREQFRRNTEEMLSDVRARSHAVLLVLAVDDLAHPLHEPAVDVGRQERIPIGSPNDLDAVPARTAKDRLELLDDLAVAADGTVEPLQVAVDDENQVIEALARGEGQGSQGLRLVDLAVSHETPDARLAGVDDAAIAEIAQEAGLVNGRDRPQTH